MPQFLKTYCGDALEIMYMLIKQGIKVDFILADPPYGTTACEWDIIIPFEPMWERLKLIRKDRTPIALFGTEPFSSKLRMSNPEEFRYDWYWEKERITNINQVKKRAGKTVENIMVFYKKQCLYTPQMIKYDGPVRKNKIKNGVIGKLSDSSTKKVKEYIDTGYRYPTQILKFKRDILKLNLFPTQKPLALIRYFILTYTNPGDTVLDFTMGSGTTICACKELNRNGIGIEKDRKTFKLAVNRINNYLPFWKF